MSSTISVKNLTKHFKDVKAVTDLSFEVPSGQIYGFLGQNGAGKSTTIRMLLTLIKPSYGSIEIFGMDLDRHRKDILRQTGAIIERPDLYKYLTAQENLHIFALMSGIKATARQLTNQLALVGLADRAHSKVKTFSLVMKPRLGIAVALVHDPKLIILDEPTNGLDPQGIADMRRLILHLSHDLGKTLVVSSHLLAEMELIAGSMLIIDKGKKVVEGKTKELLNPDKIQVEIISDDKAATIAAITDSIWKSGLLTTTGDAVLLEMQKSDIPQLNRLLAQKGINIFSLRPKHTLEDFFLSLTKN